jgi:Fic family protein
LHNYPAIKAAKMTAITALEPLIPDTVQELDDLALELVAAANGFASRLNPIMRSSVGTLVRSMNCYYSNLIEGHNTHPVDINRALAGDYSNEPEKRNLQLEARAHIEVQLIIDAGAMPFPVLSVEAIKWIHREFCQRLPAELLNVVDEKSGKTEVIVPGEFRTRMVKVGRHIPPEPEALPALMARLVEGYSARHLSKLQKLSAVGASHHRFAWIHPFLDGNGRVSRLFSHAILRELGVGSELWSVSRGLAREVENYKSLLAAADSPRRGDLDGRGNLSMKALIEFSTFFMRSCLDQVRFMEQLMEPHELMTRMEIWCAEEIAAQRLPKGSWNLLREAVIAGEFSRSETTQLTGYQERQARTVLSALLDRGLLVSPSPKGKLRLSFPEDVVERWLPRLYRVTA